MKSNLSSTDNLVLDVEFLNIVCQDIHVLCGEMRFAAIRWDQ